MLRYIDSAIDKDDNEILTVDGQDLYEAMTEQAEKDLQEVMPGKLGAEVAQTAGLNDLALGIYAAADKALGGILPGRPASPLDDAVKLEDAEDWAQERMNENEADEMMKGYKLDAINSRLLEDRGLEKNKANWLRYKDSQEM